MKKSLGCVLVAVGITLVFGVCAMAAGKIGYVDVYGAAGQSKWGKKISDDLKKEEESLRGSLDQKKQAFVTARDEYMKKKDVMDAKAKERKEKELQDMAEELQRLANDAGNKLNEQKKVATDPLFKKIYEIANKIAKDDKYDLILEKAAIVVPSEKDDITARVVSELDKTSPK